MLIVKIDMRRIEIAWLLVEMMLRPDKSPLNLLIKASALHIDPPKPHKILL